MAEDTSGDKKHDPTPWRLQKAREDGNVAKSEDLASAIILLLAIILLMTIGKQVVDTLFEYSNKMLVDPYILIIPETQDADALKQTTYSLFFETVVRFMKPMSLFFGLLLVMAVLANIFQIGFLWLPNKLFDITRIDPIKGFGRIFSMRSVVRFLMGIVKIVICAIVAWFAVESSIGEIMNLPESETGQIAAYLVWTLLLIALKVAVALVIIALVDLMYQRFQHMQKLRMSDQEMKEEVKNMMGDPQLIGKRRQFHKELIERQQVQGTEDADVVVANPTHFSVAIKFDARTMGGPVIVAKGADLMAFQIRQIAAEHNIPVIRRPMLARTLYSTVDIGKPIYLDAEHFRTLVEVIRLAYRLRGRDIDREIRERNNHM